MIRILVGTDFEDLKRFTSSLMEVLNKLECFKLMSNKNCEHVSNRLGKTEVLHSAYRTLYPRHRHRSEKARVFYID